MAKKAAEETQKKQKGAKKTKQKGAKCAKKQEETKKGQKHDEWSEDDLKPILPTQKVTVIHSVPILGAYVEVVAEASGVETVHRIPVPRDTTRVSLRGKLITAQPPSKSENPCLTKFQFQ